MIVAIPKIGILYWKTKTGKKKKKEPKSKNTEPGKNSNQI